MSMPARTSKAPLVVLIVLVVCSLLLPLAGPARALEAVVVEPDTERIELTPLGEAHEGRGDTLQIVTAPGNDGATDRMSVKARTPGTNPNWFVFAAVKFIKNDSLFARNLGGFQRQIAHTIRFNINGQA